MKIIASDSTGVRSMATFVDAGGVKIAIDPGVSYAPRRYGLPPHPIELERVEKVRERIIDELQDTDIIIITHYHYDHYLYKPEDAEVYRDKWLIIKDPKASINVSQRIRAHRLLSRYDVSQLAKRIDILDAKSYKIDGDLVIAGSEPVPHGAEGSKLGYVVMVSVECCGERFLHASDVQGPISVRALETILSLKPDVVFISGPPTYFEGVKVPEEDVHRGLENLRQLALKLPGSIIVADHHFARDIEYLHRLRQLAEGAAARVISAAEFMGVPYEPLEALRRELWSREKEREAANSDRAS